MVLLGGMIGIAHGMNLADNPIPGSEAQPTEYGPRVEAGTQSIIAKPSWNDYAPSQMTSPKKIKHDVQNYCKNIITALNDYKNENNLDTVKKEFINFYKKITYQMHIKNLEFYQALAHSLCHCLHNCAGKNEQSNLEYYTCDSKTTKGIRFLTFENGKNVYVLQFCALKEGEDDKINTYFIPSNYKLDPDREIIVIAVTFLVGDTRASLDVSRINNSKDEKTRKDGERIQPTPKMYQYNSDNFYTRLIESLIDSSTKASSYRMDALTTIYNTIPVEWRQARQAEKFYQAMLFCIITFFRSSYAQAEFYTAEGRADIAIKGDKCNSIIEFKCNKPVEEALNQIKARDYAGYFCDDGKDIVEVGIAIDTKTNFDEVIVDSEAIPRDKELSPRMDNKWERRKKTNDSSKTETKAEDKLTSSEDDDQNDKSFEDFPDDGE